MENNLEKNKNKKIKKKKCIPMDDLNKDSNINKEITEESLKRYVSFFDLDPKINFEVFKTIKSYNKYLYKYKYTLFYSDAKELGCFKDIDEKKMIETINNEIIKLNIKNKIISKIESLSKARLIKFLLYILNLDLVKENYEDILKEIKTYELDISLIYKAPIYLGNTEIKYYFFHELFVEFFLYNDESQDKSNKKKAILLSKKIEYFPNIETENSENYTEIDLTEFENRKKELFDYIDDINENGAKIKIEMNLEKNEKEIKTTIDLDEDKDKEEAENISKTYKDKIKNKSYFNFSKKINYFKCFKKVILNIFFQDNNNDNDNEIIEKIKFLYFYIIFEIKNNKDPNKKLLNSFYVKNNETDKQKFNNFPKNIKGLFNGKDSQLIIKNIKIEQNFFENIENPFIENNYLYFSFPVLLHKSFLEYDQEIYDSFLEFLTSIYKSNLLSDIYYLCPEFSDFDYPLKNDAILNEMFKNTFFIPCESNKLYGYTQKNLISVFIPVKHSNESSNRLEKFIIELSFILNTTIHEQLNHYIKSLIFFNSFRYGGNKYIESDDDLNNEENKYLEGLMLQKKTKNVNMKGKGEHRTEILLYGEVLEKLTILQGLKMFYYSTWNDSIKGHFLKFKDNYELMKKNNSGNIFSDAHLNLKEIMDDVDVCPFLKKIIEKFIKFHNIKDKNIYINTKFSYKKNQELFDENEEIGEILINPNYEEIYPRTFYRDYNP